MRMIGNRIVFGVLLMAWPAGWIGVASGQANNGLTNLLKRPTSPQPPIQFNRTSTPPQLQPRIGQPRIITSGSGKATIIWDTQSGRPITQSQAAPAPAIDPLLNLMMQQPPIDIDTPARAYAQFDPPVITAGGRATYRIIITALMRVIQPPESLPAPPGLEVVAGGRSESYATVTNTLQPRSTLNYHISAKAPGTYTIPPFSVSVSGRFMQVPAARLQVVPAGATGVEQPPRLSVEIPEGDIYVGQTVPIQVVLTDPDGKTVRGLTRVEIPTEGILLDPMFYRQSRKVVTVEGKPVAAIVQEMYVTPIKSGELKLQAQAQALLARTTPGVPAQLPGYYPLLDTDPVTITVKQLPKEGELPGFTGAIGTFTLTQPHLSSNKIRAGEPLTLTVTIKGQGNLARMIPPKLEGLWEWQTFEPTSEAAQPQLVQQRGYCTYNYTLIPLSDQIKATPRIPFSYFDPARKAYVDLTIPPVPLEVSPAAGGAKLLPPGAASLAGGGDDSRTTGERDLVMNGLSETPGVMASSLTPLQHRPWFVVLQFLPALALAGLWFWDRRRRFLAEHPEVILKTRARQGLRHYRRQLRHAAMAQDARNFVKAAVNAMREAAAPHGAANPEALVCGDVLRAIPASDRHGKNGELVQRFFTAADVLHFGGTLPEGSQLLGLRPELERLLAQMRAQL